MIRNTHRPGRHLMRDDESGLVHYDDELVKRWDGLYVRRDQYETRHPQEFVKARNDPIQLREIRTDPLVARPTTAEATLIGTTSISTRTGPASHIFSPGIGDMVIGLNFIVR